VSLLSLARDHSKRQVATARAASLATQRLWKRIDPKYISRTWGSQVTQAAAAVTAAQQLSAGDSDAYVEATLAEQGLDTEAAGQVNAQTLAGVASDGRDLLTLMLEPMIRTLWRIDKGMSPDASLAHGALDLDMVVRTQVADAGRVADGVATTARRAVQGYVRLLVPPSCSRCVLLAGKFYRYNDGFQRHPRCDCRHIPASEQVAGDIRTDTKAYFRSLSAEEQDKVFTKAGAQAIRDGADIYQVVNARQGIQTASILGRDVKITTVGNTRRSLAGSRLAREAGTRKAKGSRYRTTQAPRLMPEQIYTEAKSEGWDRDEVVRQLKRFGYLF
jgi:hypothetical protein